jgi:hypothetical protein
MGKMPVVVLTGMLSLVRGTGQYWYGMFQYFSISLDDQHIILLSSPEFTSGNPGGTMELADGSIQSIELDLEIAH